MSFKIGDKVAVNPECDTRGRFAGVVFTVVKIKPVNLLLEPVNGANGGRRVNCRPLYLLPFTGETTAAAAETKTAPGPVGVPYLPHLRSGQTVTVRPGAVTHRRWTYAASQVFVVITETAGGTRLKIARLGGETNGTTWTVPRAAVVPVVGYFTAA